MNKSLEVALLGSGGHANVVIDALSLTTPKPIITIFDEDKKKEGSHIAGITIQNGYPDHTLVHIAIGDNQIRKRLGEYLANQGKSLYSVIHPRAAIAALSTIDAGCFIAANAIVAPNAIIGKGTIINHAAIVDHDCIIGPWTHIAPNATLGGGVQIGTGCLIGAGAVILPQIHIGDYAVVGAGAVVTHSVAENQVVWGVPARMNTMQKKFY